MKKTVNLKIEESAHAALKKAAQDKGMKFYAFMEQALEEKAKRLNKESK